MTDLSGMLSDMHSAFKKYNIQRKCLKPPLSFCSLRQENQPAGMESEVNPTEKNSTKIANVITSSGGRYLSNMLFLGFVYLFSGCDVSCCAPTMKALVFPIRHPCLFECNLSSEVGTCLRFTCNYFL